MGFSPHGSAARKSCSGSSWNDPEESSPTFFDPQLMQALRVTNWAPAIMFPLSCGILELRASSCASLLEQLGELRRFRIHIVSCEHAPLRCFSHLGQHVDRCVEAGFHRLSQSID